MTVQTTSSGKKFDTFWSIYSLVCLSFSIFLWQTGRDYFIVLWMVLFGLLFAVRHLISIKLFNILKVFVALGMLFYLLRIMTELWSIW